LRREFGDSTEFGQNWRIEYGFNTDAVVDGRICLNFPRMQYGESTDVTNIVRMTFDSADVQPRRQLGDRVVTTDSVRREYGACEEST